MSNREPGGVSEDLFIARLAIVVYMGSLGVAKSATGVKSTRYTPLYRRLDSSRPLIALKTESNCKPGACVCSLKEKFGKVADIKFAFSSLVRVSPDKNLGIAGISSRPNQPLQASCMTWKTVSEFPL